MISKKNTKIISIIILALMILSTFTYLGYYLGSENSTNKINSLREYKQNEVLASVNNKNILGKDLQKILDIYTIGMPITERNKLTKNDIDIIESDSLNSIISTKALLDVIYKNNATRVKDDELKEHYSKMLKNMLDATNLTEESFFKYYNISSEDLKTLFKEDLLVAKYLDKISTVSDQELKNYYEKNKDKYKEIKVSKILIKDTTDDGKKKATDIIKELNNGKKFEELYDKYDNAKTETNSNGGDLGYQTKDDLQEELRNALFSKDLKVGDVYSKPIKTEFGYFIIKKTDERDSSIEDIKDTLTSEIKYNKQNKEISTVLKNSKIDIKIKLNVPIKELK